MLEVNADSALRRTMPNSSAARIVLACDASASAYGAFVSGDKEWRMVKDLSHKEIDAELSSTVREIRGSVEALRGLQQGGRLRAGLAVQILTDSQAAYACCSRMRGSESVFAEVRHLYLRAWAEVVCLSFVWVPRSHEALVAADHLSKWEDGSDWQFSRAFARTDI